MKDKLFDYIKNYGFVLCSCTKFALTIDKISAEFDNGKVNWNWKNTDINMANINRLNDFKQHHTIKLTYNLKLFDSSYERDL